jgi:hypothetical protein
MVEIARRKMEDFLERAPSLPYLVPEVSFGVKDQKDVALLVKLLLRRQGLSTNVRCTSRRLSIGLSSVPLEFGSTGILDILSVMMAVGPHLAEVCRVQDDFVFSIDFWARGRIKTTLGKTMGFVRKIKSGSVAPEEFWDAFDFRIGPGPSIQP